MKLPTIEAFAKNVPTLYEPQRCTRKDAGQNERIDHSLTSASVMLPRKDDRFILPAVEIRTPTHQAGMTSQSTTASRPTTRR